MNTHWQIIVCLFFVFVACAKGQSISFVPPSENERGLALGAISQESELLQKLLKPDADFSAIGRPGAGDWLANHEERGQGFLDFQLSNANRPDKGRRIIYFQPIENFSPENSPELEALRQYAATFFQMEVRVLPVYEAAAMEFTPRINQFSRKPQILAGSVMAFLKKRLPSDAFCLIAVTMTDLYPQASWNFVFGQASLKERVGVFSFARFDPVFFGLERPARTADFNRLMLRRSCHTLTHEISHMFGLWHCIYYKCLINGSNSLSESDRIPQHVCPICLRKLHDAIGFDAVKRYRELEAFYEKKSWADDAEWVRRQIAKVAN